MGETASGLRVNADGDTDADAYVETLPAIAIKPPWIDCATNGGRLYVFQQDSAPHRKALKTHGWMNRRELPLSCHTKLSAAS
ncbi:hypothetical protein ACTXT7_014953 [Hymenolepis weldensis]